MQYDERHPWLAEVAIDGLYSGKPERFSQWRAVLADIVGAPIDYVSRRRPFQGPASAVHPPLTLEFVEPRITVQTWGTHLPTGVRSGIWDTTPEEPLLSILLARVPGATFEARHAAAIARRLDEIDELVHFVGQGWVTALHENARHCFAEQALTGKDMMMSGGYEPGGWWTPDLEQ
ncbi:hypothetical protein [Devosia sp. SL43]|uniref:hypothetical protein n=1 Tax=Devosia sp. SL43 TaxID=2806348 RepID=UPI001F1CD767|nr:hypothetical protein [Devosia sp. SL43]UJW83928.1 hypothetical protein IM737_10650 [Devosia sp. SL43]